MSTQATESKPQQPAQQVPTPADVRPQQPEAPAPRPAPTVGEHGFPENTPVSEMTDAQAAAYWRNQSRVQQAARQAAEQELGRAQQAAQQAAMSEQERAVAQAREEGANEARLQATTDTAAALYRMALRGTGLDEAAINDHMSELRLSAFVVNGQVDESRITASVNRFRPPAPQRNPDTGFGGSRGGAPLASGTGAGAALFRSRQKPPINQ